MNDPGMITLRDVIAQLTDLVGQLDKLAGPDCYAPLMLNRSDAGNLLRILKTIEDMKLEEMH